MYQCIIIINNYFQKKKQKKQRKKETNKQRKKDRKKERKKEKKKETKKQGKKERKNERKKERKKERKEGRRGNEGRCAAWKPAAWFSAGRKSSSVKSTYVSPLLLYWRSKAVLGTFSKSSGMRAISFIRRHVSVRT